MRACLALPHTFILAVDNDISNTACWHVVDVGLDSCQIFKAVNAEGDGLHKGQHILPWPKHVQVLCLAAGHQVNRVLQSCCQRDTS